MSLEKVLHKIQFQINDLTPLLELFVDETIQPSVENCNKLQQQLSLIQEHLAVYKHNKIDKELSPSFSIHAKVSEKEMPKETAEELVEEIKATVNAEKLEQKTPIIEQKVDKKIDTSKTIPPFTIGINDKFRFINELFKQNSAEYNVAIEQLSNLKNWHETETYLTSLKTLYNWKKDNEAVTYFFSIAKKRFN